MKSIVGKTVFLVACCALLLLPGCRNPIGHQPPQGEDPAAGTGYLSLEIGRQAKGRTVQPSWPDGQFQRFSLGFQPDSGNAHAAFTVLWTVTSGTVSLGAGSWLLTVTAYLQGSVGDGFSDPVAQSEARPITVSSGANGTIYVYLLPIADGFGLRLITLGAVLSFCITALSSWLAIPY